MKNTIISGRTSFKTVLIMPVIIAVIAVIGLAITGCDDGKTSCNHSWVWKVTTHATSDASGLETEKCSKCGEKSGKTKLVEQLNKSGVKSEKIENENPGEEKSGDVEPGVEKPAEDKPDNEKPGENKSGDEKPGEEKPGEDKPVEQKQPVAINIPAIKGVHPPAADAIPVSVITETNQYTGTVSWNGNPSIFAMSTVYTATITLNAKDGYTLDGVTANFFTVAGTSLNAVNAVNSGVITAVFPVTINPAPELIAKWFTSQEIANSQNGLPAQSSTPAFEFTADGKIKLQGKDSDYTYSLKDNIISFTHLQNGKAGSSNFLIFGTTLTLSGSSGTWSPDNGIYFKQGSGGSVIGSGDPDFVSGTVVTTFNPDTAAKWEAVRQSIISGGENKNYIINIIGNISVTGANGYSGGTFGAISGVKISLRGTGVLALSNETGKTGALLSINDYQTVYLHDLTLQGITPNNDALVIVADNAAFIMRSGKIKDNKNINMDSLYKNGGGIRNTGTFVMNGGEISGNSTFGSGGGVYGSLDMHGGEIYGNIAGENGGGVYAQLKISTGKIYGSDSSPDKNNHALNGKGDSYYEYLQSVLAGTYENGVFTPNTNGGIVFAAEDNMVWFINGESINTAIGNTPDALIKKWYTTQDGADWLDGNYIEFTADGRILKTGNTYEGLTFTANGNTITVYNNGSLEKYMFAITGTLLPLLGSGSLAGNYYQSNPIYATNVFNISSNADWYRAMNRIKNKSGEFIYNIQNNFEIMGGCGNFSGTNLLVTINGIGNNRIISLSSKGNIISVNSGAKVILNNITFKGLRDDNRVNYNNNTSLIHISDSGELVMNNGVKITNNCIYLEDTYGSGVRIDGGKFIMNGGEISDNCIFGFDNAYGGGIAVNGGIFEMHGGIITRNWVSAKKSSGGGISNLSGSVYIANGTIYGKNGGINSNGAITHDAFHCIGKSHYGVYNHFLGEWIIYGYFGNITETIIVDNGVWKR